MRIRRPKFPDTPIGRRKRREFEEEMREFNEELSVHMYMGFLMGAIGVVMCILRFSAK